MIDNSNNLNNLSEEKLQEIRTEIYNNWLKMREDTKDDEGKLCYCGHTFKCDCANPDQKTFQESISRGVLFPDDPNNGWESQYEEIN